jgi:hypothetical protein
MARKTSAPLELGYDGRFVPVAKERTTLAGSKKARRQAGATAKRGHRVGGCAVGSEVTFYAPGVVLLVQSRATA